MPMGSRPGMINRARAPAIRPITNHQTKAMTPILCFLQSNRLYKPTASLVTAEAKTVGANCRGRARGLYHSSGAVSMKLGGSSRVGRSTGRPVNVDQRKRQCEDDGAEHHAEHAKHIQTAQN